MPKRSSTEADVKCTHVQDCELGEWGRWWKRRRNHLGFVLPVLLEALRETGWGEGSWDRFPLRDILCLSIHLQLYVCGALWLLRRAENAPNQQVEAQGRRRREERLWQFWGGGRASCGFLHRRARQARSQKSQHCLQHVPEWEQTQETRALGRKRFQAIRKRWVRQSLIYVVLNLFSLSPLINFFTLFYNRCDSCGRKI